MPSVTVLSLTTSWPLGLVRGALPCPAFLPKPVLRVRVVDSLATDADFPRSPFFDFIDLSPPKHVRLERILGIETVRRRKHHFRRYYFWSAPWLIPIRMDSRRRRSSVLAV